MSSRKREGGRSRVRQRGKHGMAEEAKPSKLERFNKIIWMIMGVITAVLVIVIMIIIVVKGTGY